MRRALLFAIYNAFRARYLLNAVPPLPSVAVLPNPKSLRMNHEDYRLLQAQIDALKDDNQKPYQACSALAGDVQNLLSCNHYDEANTCLRSITSAYDGARTNRLKMAIENAFLFRLGHFIFCSHERTRMLSIMPQMLRERLMQQVLSSGI